jgi:hypothetical protein
MWEKGSSQPILSESLLNIAMRHNTSSCDPPIQRNKNTDYFGQVLTGDELKGEKV